MRHFTNENDYEEYDEHSIMYRSEDVEREEHSIMYRSEDFDDDKY